VFPIRFPSGDKLYGGNEIPRGTALSMGFESLSYLVSHKILEGGGGNRQSLKIYSRIRKEAGGLPRPSEGFYFHRKKKCNTVSLKGKEGGMTNDDNVSGPKESRRWKGEGKPAVQKKENKPVTGGRSCLGSRCGEKICGVDRYALMGEEISGGFFGGKKGEMIGEQRLALRAKG